LNINKICFLILASLVACTPDNASTVSTEEGVSAAQSTIVVATVLAEEQMFHHTIQCQGQLRSARWVELSFLTGGKIAQINAKNAALVRKGQLIAYLENDQQKIAVEEARIALLQAESLYENELLILGDSSKNASNWGRIKEKAGLKSGLHTAKVALKRAEFEFTQTYIYAPFEGILSGLQLQAGAIINPGAVVATVQDQSYFNAWLQVLEFDLAKIKVGDMATIVPTATNMPLAAKVVEIDPSINENGYALIKCRVESRSGIYDGMSVAAHLSMAVGQRLVVPIDAVVIKKGRPVVFTYENGLAKWNYIVKTEENNNEVAVGEGLAVGNQVIVTNNLQLAHDTPVELASASISATTNPE
jgi:RND family efflux transporter MFP subunit